MSSSVLPSTSKSPAFKRSLRPLHLPTYCCTSRGNTATSPRIARSEPLRAQVQELGCYKGCHHVGSVLVRSPHWPMVRRRHGGLTAPAIHLFDALRPRRDNKLV